MKPIEMLKYKKEEKSEPAEMKMGPIEQLAAHVFQARNIAQREHWKISGPKHEALGEFYASIIEAIDVIIEVDEGMYGLIGDFEVEDAKPTDLVKYIREEAAWIEANRDKFSKCNAVLALIDDLTKSYLLTAFKLENLK